MSGLRDYFDNLRRESRTPAERMARAIAWLGSGHEERTALSLWAEAALRYQAGEPLRLNYLCELRTTRQQVEALCASISARRIS